MNTGQRDELAMLRERRAHGAEPEVDTSLVSKEYEDDIKSRHSKRRRRLRSRFLIRRGAALAAVCAAAILLIILISSMFGLFNARIYVQYEGKQAQKITNEQLSECLAELNRMNVFKISEGLVREKMSQIPYINREGLRISKRYIPASVTIYYSETEPYGCIKQGGSYIMFDKDGKALEYSDKAADFVPLVKGMDELAGNRAQVFDAGSRTDALMLCLRKMKEYDILDKVTEITVDENDVISFVYDDRYDVNCGSSYEISSKLGLFKAAVNHGSMTDSARGTFDLSEPGKATYSP